MSDRKLFALGLFLSSLSIGFFPIYLALASLVIAVILMIRGAAGKGVYLFIQGVILGGLGSLLGANGVYGVWFVFTIVSFIIDAFVFWMAKAEA